MELLATLSQLVDVTEGEAHELAVAALAVYTEKQLYVTRALEMARDMLNVARGQLVDTDQPPPLAGLSPLGGVERSDVLVPTSPSDNDSSVAPDSNLAVLRFRRGS
jgi:hypothetical protein